MFKRFRRLRISLAAKCQILFGSAVALIIFAALFVPWQRMGQLTEQLDRGAASALAENTVTRHIWLHRAASANDVVAVAATHPTTRPTAITKHGSGVDGSGMPSARLISIAPRRDGPVPSRFERQAIARFRKEPDRRWYFDYYERPDGSQGYRYAQPVFLTQDCAVCHSASADAETRPTRAPVAANLSKTIAVITAPATQPTTAVAEAGTNARAGASGDVETTSKGEASSIIGIVAVDIASRIDANQLLLNQVFILAAGLLASTLAIIAFYLITTRLILQPVRVLQETAEKVSQGDLNIRSDISTGDEFQQLSETFNVMLANLKQSADQLRSINKSLDLRLGQLAESNLALYESNRLKSEFLANVSHELRTPLNSILGFADLLKDALPTNAEGIWKPGDGNAKAAEPKSARYVNNILQSGRHLLDLINDLLDLAKIEAGRMEIRSEPLSVSDLFEGLLNILKPLSEQKKLSLVATVDAEVPIIHTDPAKLQQVLYNFLSNAIKFSPAGSRIDLVATLDDPEHVRVAVADRGPGIDPDQQQLIFEKFRQIDGGVTRTHSGTGLGLAISKELTSLLGGSIGVRSARGEGATFWVTLPLKIQSGSMDMRGRLVLT